MSDDLLKRLSELAREQAAEDEARPAGPPLDADARARFTARILQEMKQAPASTPEMKEAARARAKPRWARRTAPLVFALAAGIAIFVVTRGEEGAPLPGYSLEVHGIAGVRSTMEPSPSGSPLLVAPDSELEVLLRPSSAVEGEVQTKLFLRSRDGQSRPIKAETERSDTGALRLRIRGEALLPEPHSEGTLVVVVGRPGALPDAWSDDSSAVPTGVQKFVQSLRRD